MLAHSNSTSTFLLLVAAVSLGCVGPSGKLSPLGVDSPALGSQLILDETYIAGIGIYEYLLPYGSYSAESEDERGVYYRSPIPVKRRGLFGGALGRGETLIEGGIYIPHSSFHKAIGFWLYLIREDGRIQIELIPGSLASGEDDFWHLEHTGSVAPSPAA